MCRNVDFWNTSCTESGIILPELWWRAFNTSSNRTSNFVSIRQISNALAPPRSRAAPSMNSIKVISPSPLSKNSNKLRRSWYSSSSWLIQNLSFGEFASLANSSRLSEPSPESSMVWKSFRTFRVYMATSRSFCLKANSSSELAVFMVCCTKTALTTFKTANPKTHRYSRKKTENHSLMFSTTTRHGGPQFAKRISNIDSNVREKVP
mmetsp:Transcript_20124/g.47353  ORF Transcript_20124/g.47353 Transcript_20124/m.47353 type:complete len:207 (+) Transcript_20124:299-919(+)